MRSPRVSDDQVDDAVHAGDVNRDGHPALGIVAPERLADSERRWTRRAPRAQRALDRRLGCTESQLSIRGGDTHARRFGRSEEHSGHERGDEQQGQQRRRQNESLSGPLLCAIDDHGVRLRTAIESDAESAGRTTRLSTGTCSLLSARAVMSTLASDRGDAPTPSLAPLASKYSNSSPV